MGTDIHGVWQAQDKETGKWSDIESDYDQDRHYQLFAVLADVRNGFGFAGVRTGDAVSCIAKPRGMPPDFVVDGESHRVEKAEYISPYMRKYADEDGLEVWMGDHSHSWLTGEEMMQWYESAEEVTKYGVVDRETYESWDKKSNPSYYCGGVSGPGVKVATEQTKDDVSDWTHISVKWTQSLKEELAYFFDEVAELQQKHGNIRFVFGFDS